MKTPLPTLLAAANLDEAKVADELELTEVAVINKLAHRRKWSLAEGVALARLISRRLRRRVTVEEIDFAPAPSAVATATAAGKE